MTSESAPTLVDVTRCPAGEAPIRVYRGGDIPATMRWWNAEDAGIIAHVATYYAPMVDGFVSRAHVAAVEKLHPGPDMYYVYL